MKYNGTIPKIPVNFSVLFYLLFFEINSSNSHTSTLWKLNSDRTKIIEGDAENMRDDFVHSMVGTDPIHQFLGSEDLLFNIITSTERYSSSWIKHNDEYFCNDCENGMNRNKNPKKNNTEVNENMDQKCSGDEAHDLSCGKPVNFTFYDNLVGVMNRDKHPPLVEPDAMLEFMRKFKFKIGKIPDLELIENKLKRTKKEKPKSVGTLHQLGNFWRVKGDPRRAIECFRKEISCTHLPGNQLARKK